MLKFVDWRLVSLAIIILIGGIIFIKWLSQYEDFDESEENEEDGIILLDMYSHKYFRARKLLDDKNLYIFDYDCDDDNETLKRYVHNE